MSTEDGGAAGPPLTLSDSTIIRMAVDRMRKETNAHYLPLRTWLLRCADYALEDERRDELDGLVFAAHSTETEFAIEIARAYMTELP